MILQRSNEEPWVEKAVHIRRRGGMALMITHPDYASEPGLLTAYTRFLETFADDRTVWRALPRDVSAWWRRRASSRLEHSSGRWRIAGPASEEASIQFARE